MLNLKKVIAMADDFSFTIEGAAELISDIERAADAFPDEMNKAMQKVNREWRKDVNRKMTFEHPQRHAKGKRKFENEWRSDTEYNTVGVITQIETRNTAPHWHLYENGHEKYDFHGKPTGGFVQGKHIAEQTRMEYETKMPDEIETAAKEILAKGGF